LLLLKANVADIVDSYSKTETDTLLDTKADKTDTNTKEEDDALILLKANVADIVDSYSKTEDDILLLLKADKTELIDAYSKSQDDALLLLKANVTDLANYVDLTSTQTIPGQKQFGIKSVSSISKQSKNDASILLAGGGHMLISSLVTQPQFQEVRDIAAGKSKAYVFSIQKELIDCIAIQDNVAKLVIGDNFILLIKKLLTTGAATGSGKAINDISIDGKTLTPAKNTTFVTTGFDQSITGMKTFTSTVISNDIQYSGYDNSSVFLAGGGVRSIADIQSASHPKSEDDALLLLKVDKTQLIDSNTKTETNNLLNSKANIGVSYYTKTKTDELLDEKADSTDLANYITLGNSQTITSNKTFNNNCRFVNSIDGMSTITGFSFIKTGADDTVVLLGAGGTKPISEFVGALTFLSKYYTKTQTYSQTEANNKFVRLEGQIQQTITGRLKHVSPFDYQDETQDPVANIYLTISEIDAKLSSKIDLSTLGNLVNTIQDQTVNGSKTFTSNVNATGFVKAGKDDTSVLLACGGDKLLSSFDGIDDLSSSAFSSMNGAVVQCKLIRTGNLYIFSLLAYGGNYNAGTFNPDYLVTDDTAVATYIPFPSSTIDKGGYVMITHSTGLITLKSTINTQIQCASATCIK
ncbi:MAG: hypothetical protein EZS28_022154, partial [Streblomastix strix]